MRKNIIFVLILTLCVSIFQIPSVNAAQTSDYKESVNMLEAFGFLNKSFGSAKNKVSRRDFYTVVCNMINSDSVDRLIESGIAEPGNLDDYISVDDAEETLVNALGYGEVKNVSGSFNDLGITSGVNDFGILTSENMVTMIKNACETEVMQIDLGGGDYSLSIREKETILTKYHNIFKMKGIVKGIDGISLSGKNVPYGDYMQVGDRMFATGGADVSRFLGREVELYYRESQRDEPEYVYAAVTNKNTVISIEADDIVAEETTRDEIRYEDGEKIRKEKISKVADMVYNNQGYPDFTAEDLTPASGRVELVDNNGDGVIECIFVYDYKTIVVEKFSERDETITDKYTGEVIGLKDYDDAVMTKDGEEVLLTQLKVWNVLYVMGDKYNEKIEISVSDKYVDGSLTRVDQEELTVSIDGVEYEINPEYYEAENDENVFDISGGQRRFYLDPDGRIAAVSANFVDGGYRYGYLFRSYEDETGDGYFFQVFTQEGEWVNYKLKDKLRCNGEQGTDDGVFNSVFERQMIRYSLNGAGEIKAVETAEVVTQGSDSEKFRKMNASGIYRIEDRGFSSKYYLGDDVTIFQIPTGVDENGNNYADDKNNYNISNTWPYASNQSYTLEFYDPDKNNSAEIIVYQSSPAVKSTTYSPVFLVGSVGEMTIGDEVVQTASGLVLGQELSLTAENVGDFDHLKPGDAIKFHMNGDGRADYVEVMCSADGERVLTDVENLETYATVTSAVCYIDDVDIENGFIKVRGDTGTRILKTSDVNVSIYDPSTKKKVEKGELSDISSGDFAVVFIQICLVTDIVVYKN